MNLSCGKCKTIRPFSGDPPKCDVCGWVLGTETPHPKNPSEPLESESFKGKTADGVAKAVRFLIKITAFWLGFAGLVYVLYLIFASDQTKLSNEYNAPEDHVFVQPKPHGCDFDDAPLGSKHCHYEKHVEVERACPGPGCRVTSVYVSWSKVNE
jgi:hypothetical protein